MSDNNQSKPVADEVQASDQFAQTLSSLEKLIERSANQLEELKAQIKERKQMLSACFANDEKLSEVDEKLAEFKLLTKERKTKLLQEPQVVDLNIKLKELTERKKELEESLSNHLVNHYSMTNSTSFDTSDGDQWEYIIQGRVKAKPQ